MPFPGRVGAGGEEDGLDKTKNVAARLFCCCFFVVFSSHALTSIVNCILPATTSVELSRDALAPCVCCGCAVSISPPPFSMSQDVYGFRADLRPVFPRLQARKTVKVFGANPQFAEGMIAMVRAMCIPTFTLLGTLHGQERRRR